MNKVLFKSFNLQTNWEHINNYINPNNLYSDKKITFFVNSIPKNIEKKKEDIFIFLQVESASVISNIIGYLIKNDDDFFDKLMVFDERLLKKYEKAILFLPNTHCFWVTPTNELNINYNLPNVLPIDYEIKKKKFQVSMLCGDKNWCPGHKIRRDYWINQNKINIPKKFYYSLRNKNNGQTTKQLPIFENNLEIKHSIDKTECFIDSMFHIAIENNKSKHYFTEKLIDCIITRTIPIYYGCNNIADYFNIKGFIIIESINDIYKINELTEDYYVKNYKYIEENYQRLLKMDSFEKQIKKHVKLIEDIC